MQLSTPYTMKDTTHGEETELIKKKKWNTDCSEERIGSKQGFDRKGTR